MGWDGRMDGRPRKQFPLVTTERSRQRRVHTYASQFSAAPTYRGHHAVYFCAASAQEPAWAPGERRGCAASSSPVPTPGRVGRLVGVHFRVSLSNRVAGMSVSRRQGRARQG